MDAYGWAVEVLSFNRDNGKNLQLKKMKLRSEIVTSNRPVTGKVIPSCDSKSQCRKVQDLDYQPTIIELDQIDCPLVMEKRNGLVIIAYLGERFDVLDFTQPRLYFSAREIIRK